MSQTIRVAADRDSLLPDEGVVFDPVWGTELAARHVRGADWVWQGFLARGEVTLLTSQWKTGKTTLLSVLLDRIKRGGALLERPVQAARAAVLSEEAESHWSRRCRQFGAWSHVCFLCRPTRHNPTLPQWLALIDRLCRLREEQRVDVVVIDPLSTLLPRGAENQAEKILDALRPLERLTQAGAAVLLLHHPRKGQSLAGQTARGSGALSAYADVMIEMHPHSTSSLEDRRRRLLAWSRHDDTPRELLIELNADGRDYCLAVDVPDDGFEQAREAIETVLADADSKLTRQQISGNWPQRTRPSGATLNRWLARAVEARFVLSEGEGVRGDPVRYWLPGRKNLLWLPDPAELLGL
jgi:hypothetical protein